MIVRHRHPDITVFDCVDPADFVAEFIGNRVAPELVEIRQGYGADKREWGVAELSLLIEFKPDIEPPEVSGFVRANDGHEVDWHACPVVAEGFEDCYWYDVEYGEA